jgi:hypothetical protein
MQCRDVKIPYNYSRILSVGCCGIKFARVIVKVYLLA